MRTPTLTQSLYGAYAGGAILLLGAGHASTGPIMWATVLMIGAIAGAFGCVMAVKSLPKNIEVPWIIFGLAATAQLAAQLAHLWDDAAVDSFALLNFISYLLFVAGLGWLLHQRDRARVFEIVLDAGLVILAFMVVVRRWAPGAQMVTSGEHPFAHILTAIGTPVLAGTTVLLSLVLVLARTDGRGRGVAVLLGSASLGLAGSTIPVVLGNSACCTVGDPTALFYVIGWSALGLAGAVAASAGIDANIPPAADIASRRLRLVVAPAVAIVIGAVIIDAAWHEPLRDATAFALSLLGMLFALRVSQLLFATHQQSAQQIELTQSRLLVEVSQALAGRTDLDATLNVVTKCACRLLNARAAAIELLDESGQTLELRATHGLSRSAKNLRFDVATSFSGRVVREGRARTTMNPREEPDIHESSLRHLGSSPMAAAPLRFQNRPLGVLSCIGKYPFDANDLELLGALAAQAAVAIENARLFEQVRVLSLTDPLTGLANRRQLTKDLSREFAAAIRGRALVAVMFDLNGFKQYNDKFGHPAGDEALRKFAAALSISTRAQNTAARYGGDEFLTLLTDTNRAGAKVFIERVRSMFPGPDAENREKRLSVSAGIAEYTPSMKTGEDLVEAADRELYLEKRQRTVSLATSQTFEQPAQ